MLELLYYLSLSSRPVCNVAFFPRLLYNSTLTLGLLYNGTLTLEFPYKDVPVLRLKKVITHPEFLNNVSLSLGILYNEFFSWFFLIFLLHVFSQNLCSHGNTSHCGKKTKNSTSLNICAT